MALTFRGYVGGDFEPMFRLDELCFDPRFRFSRRDMKRLAEARNACVILAFAGEELVGFCIAHVESAAEHEGVGYVVTLDVAEAWRGKGIAGSLMEKVEAQVAEAGCFAMVLHVYIDNVAAIRFYERNGYGEVGVSRGFYGSGIDGVVYRKQLVAA